MTRVLKNALFVLANFNIYFLVLFVSATPIYQKSHEFVHQSRFNKKMYWQGSWDSFSFLMCGTEFSAQTCSIASSRTLPFITAPILPRKLKRRWKLPRVQTTLKDFASVISKALNYLNYLQLSIGAGYNGCHYFEFLSLMLGEFKCKKYTGHICRIKSMIESNKSIDFPGYSPLLTSVI